MRSQVYDRNGRRVQEVVIVEGNLVLGELVCVVLILVFLERDVLLLDCDCVLVAILQVVVWVEIASDA